VQVRANDVLAGKYRITRMLGEGGMGIVAEAVHLGLGHRVALKLLRSELVRPEHRERFFREARAAGSLHSEHVVGIKDVDTLPDGTPFLVMEYLEGADLGRVVHQCGALPADVATDYVLQACHALAEAHATGIVHRDLKPANLFLTQRLDGTSLVKVLDFGIAKIAGSETARDLTATSAYMGSPSYMSPEQVRSAKRVDARTDLWALGVILYELLVGSPPFDGETAGDVFVKISTEPPRPFPFPLPGLDAVILRCLEKDPERRYRDIAELAAALLPFAGAGGRARAEAVARITGRELPMPVAGVPVASSPHAAVTTLGLGAGQSQALATRPRRSLTIAAVAIVIVGAVATGGYLKLAPRSTDAPAAASTGPAAALPVVPVASPPAGVAASPPGGSAASSESVAPVAPVAPAVTPHVAPARVADPAPPSPASAASVEGDPPPAAAPAAPVEAPPPKVRKPARRGGAKPGAKPDPRADNDNDFIEDRR
jgi:eukaryotic-like serine/threonine-protein kinase